MQWVVYYYKQRRIHENQAGRTRGEIRAVDDRRATQADAMKSKVPGNKGCSSGSTILQRIEGNWRQHKTRGVISHGSESVDRYTDGHSVANYDHLCITLNWSKDIFIFIENTKSFSEATVHFSFYQTHSVRNKWCISTGPCCPLCAWFFLNLRIYWYCVLVGALPVSLCRKWMKLPARCLKQHLPLCVPICALFLTCQCAEGW